jgi:hypothetical protein
MALRSSMSCGDNVRSHVERSWFFRERLDEGPRRRLAVEEGAAELDGEDDTPDILDQVRELRDGKDGDQTQSGKRSTRDGCRW